MMPDVTSLNSHLISAPAEDLHTSQGHISCANTAKKKRWSWWFASWNVRSMLDVEGPLETARRGRDTSHAQERKVDLIAREIDRYAIKIAALQETKWLGSYTYNVGNIVLLTAGRPVKCTCGGLANTAGRRCGPCTYWPCHNSLESSRRAVEGVELKVDLCTLAGRK